MSSSSPYQQSFFDPGLETLSDNGNSSSSSFSSLLGDNPPPNTHQNPVVNNRVPVVNIPDSEETESDSGDLSEGGRNVPLPKIYKTFLTEVYNHSSEYTSLHAIETPHFPLFWSLEPSRVPIVKFDQLSFDEKIDVAFLRNQAPIDCGFLLGMKISQLGYQLIPLFVADKMPSKANVPQAITNDKTLKRLLKKEGVDPSAPGSKMQTVVPTHERRKKQKLDTSSGNQQQMETVGDVMVTHPDGSPTKTTKSVGLTSEQSVPSSTDAPQGSRPPLHPQTGGNSAGMPNQTSVPTSSGTQSSITTIPADKLWCLFNNFTGSEGSDVTSIFDHRFPVEEVVSREFNKKEDIARVNKVGMRNVGKHLMTMGIQTSFFGYCFDSALNSIDKELKDRSLKIQDLTAKLQATESATQTIASLEKSLLEAKTKLTATETEKTTAEARCLELDTKYSDAVCRAS
ncbi:hypothetical protein SESBI_38016 [Sesbania bispinosa]|nr:hypothetical protein SESBI_38016 [Sesbania bispinosa]